MCSISGRRWLTRPTHLAIFSVISRHILNFLRDGKLAVLPEKKEVCAELLIEARYYLLEGLVKGLVNHLESCCELTSKEAFEGSMNEYYKTPKGQVLVTLKREANHAIEEAMKKGEFVARVKFRSAGADHPMNSLFESDMRKRGFNIKRKYHSIPGSLTLAEALELGWDYVVSWDDEEKNGSTREDSVDEAGDK